MPTVPRFNQGTVEARGIPNARVFEGTSNSAGAFREIAGAAAGLGQVFAQEAQEERDRADNASVIEAETALDAFENDSLFNPTAGAFAKSGKDAFDLPNQVLPGYDSEVTRIEEGLGSDRAKLVFKQRAARRRNGIGQQLNRKESQEREVYYDQQDVSGLQSSQAVAANFYNNPTRIGEELAKQDAIIDARGARKGLSPEQVAEAKRASRSGTLTDVVQRYIARGDYKSGAKYFESVREGIAADDATRIESALTVERRREAEQLERDALRREARAERTIGAIDRQIASGIPATPEMWRDWESQVKGTPLAAEFQARLADEREVQDLLGKPVQDQLAFIQQKETALAQGGTLTQAANLNRLKAVVSQNLQLLSQSPLIFNERRTGTPTEPLSLDLLASGDGGTTLQLRDRVEELRSMQKQLGAAVPLKPLLPQEAQQLTSTLQAVPPARQAELLDGLAVSFADPEAFRAAMQQIAPDAPVTALAGLLAGKAEEITTKRRLFGPNTTVSGKKVAQTLLEGQAILAPNSTEKAQDGRPKVALYLPEQNLLQQEFTDLVGDAFRGRPGAADIAFQAAMSYYVGRAAQTGRIASSKEDVDTALVSEAVTAVLGSVSDYNGAGKVLAPWGMDEDRFEDLADQAFRRTAADRGLPAERIDDLAGDIGLQNAGEGRYRVTIGNNYLTDSLGTPLVLELGKGEGARGLR
jgi:hypothetical protein